VRDVYLRLAYKALNEGFEFVGPSYLSRKLGISKPTAHEALIKLSERKLGVYVPKKGFKLNSAGIEKAKELTMKHRLMECLFNHLGMSPEVACREASRVEDHVSKELINLLKTIFSDRKLCPCGERIGEDFDEN
jgi:Mn-dependent DtxR family transcriptional regulator